RARKQDEDPAEARVRQRRQEEPRVVDENADVAETAPAHFCEQLDHTGLEYLGADETDVRKGRRLLGQMLPGTEANLEPELNGSNREEVLQVEAAVRRQIDTELRQQAREQVALAWTQPPAAAPAVEDSPSRVGDRLRVTSLRRRPSAGWARGRCAPRR